MENRLVINKGISGLGNRLRCVAATIEYAKKTNRAVYIDWTDGMFSAKGDNAFNKYFRIVNYPSVTNLADANCKTFYPAAYAKIPPNGDIYDYFERKQIENRYVRKALHYVFKGMHILGDRCQVIDDNVAKLSHIYQCFQLKPEYRRKYRETGLFTYGSHLNKNIDADAVVYVSNIPFYSPDTMRKHIALQPEIEELVNSFVKKNKLDRDTVSVHVRASGKKCFGDIKKFIYNLKIFCSKNNIKRIFLCTDNNKIEGLFKKHFPMSLVTQDKYIPVIGVGETGIHDYARDSGDEELKERLTLEAIIDMFAMARTKYLFYQFGSTFSEISKVYQQHDRNAKSWMNLRAKR